MGDYGFGLLHTASLSSSSAALLFRPRPGSSPLAPASCPPLFSDDPAGLNGGEGHGDGDGGHFNVQAPFCPTRDLQEPPPSSCTSSTTSSSSSSSSPSSAELPDPEAEPPSQLQMDSGHLLSSSTNAGVLGFPSLQHQDMATPSGPSSPPLPSFAAPWSVHTSSPPPQAAPPAPQPQPPQPPPPSSEPDSGFYPALPSSMSPGFFQSFSPVPAVSVQGFGGPFSPQQPPQSRRSPGSPHMPPQQHGAFLQQRNNYNHHQVINNKQQHPIRPVPILPARLVSFSAGLFI